MSDPLKDALSNGKSSPNPQYAETDGSSGHVAIEMPHKNAHPRELVEAAGLDPDLWMIDGPVNTRRWMRWDGQWLYYYKFNVVIGETPEQIDLHVDDLVKRIRRRKPRSKDNAAELPNDTYLVALSDWQVGKALGGIGTPELIERVHRVVQSAVADIKALRKRGHVMDHVAIVGLGDLVEQCEGHYGNQLFTVDLNRRDQMRVLRELLFYVIDTLYPLFDYHTVAAVGGNHGENRGSAGKITNDADNDDVAAFETIKEAYDRAGVALEWVLPQDELSIVLPLADGITVGFTHGHLFRKGSTAQQKAFEWWKGQVFGEGAVRDATILFTGHFHHFTATSMGPRTHVQTPAMDCGSKWFSDSTGEQAPAGMVTARITTSTPVGYDDLRVHWADERTTP